MTNWDCSPHRLIPTLAALLLLPAWARAQHPHAPPKCGLEACLAAASEIRTGIYVKVEYLVMTPEGVPTYEVEVRDPNGVEWELMCNARTGTVYEVEREVEKASDELFRRRQQVDERAARATVLALYPGTVKELEFEIESDGRASYEFDVVDAQGQEIKVEVDATTGEIVEVSFEKWEIGVEPAERP